ncbi:MAG: YgfZ/GcvT domain-containing protein [Planctomycetaceae bacterium]
MASTIDERLRAWGEGRAFADLSSWRKLVVEGADALSWLQDLLSADVASLTPGIAGPSLVLSPTGRVRAVLWVARDGDAVWLLQTPGQPESVGRILDPYILSADVRLIERTDDVDFLAVPRVAAGLLEGASMSPSWLGDATDVLVPAGDARATLTGAGIAPLGEEAVEALRIVRGRPRMGVDVGPEHLAAEAGMDPAIAHDKGCFLGQESVAKVRNLGHPPSVLLHVRGDGPVRAREAVLDDDAEVGIVTSAAVVGGGSVAFVRVRWEARERPLASRGGTALSAVPPVA